jgi:capsular exopolysaccharide synthesis family protein
VLKLPRKASPTPQGRQKLALERAELAAALARAGHAPNAADPMQQRLNALDRQAQDNDALDDEIARLQGEVERLTALDNELRQRMRGGSSSPESSVAISLVRQPESDSATVWPKPWPILGVSVLAGLLLGVVAATAMDLTSVCLQDADDAAIWGQTQVIGHVPAMSQDLHSPPLRGQCVAVSPNHPSAQACRSVRAKVESVMVEGIDKTILITGPGNFQGKSVLASNLAIAMARAGRRVALVDAHHHNPAINGIFAIDDSVGLDGAIEGRFKISDVLHVTELSGLEVLPTGSSDADWSELLNHPRFLAALTELSERFDRVIIDGGPALMDECRIISAFCDATILAVDARRCRRRDLRAAAEGLRAVGAKLAGIVLIDLPVPAAVVKTPVPAPAPRRAAIRGRAQADAPAGMAETA